MSRAQPEPMDTTLRVTLRLGLPPSGEPGRPPEPGDIEPGDIEQLCETLLSAGAVDAHRPVLAPPSPGWRGGDGQLPDVVATIADSVPVLGQMISALRRWLAARGTPRRSIEVSINDNTIKVSGLSQDSQDKLIAVFIEQVCGES